MFRFQYQAILWAIGSLPLLVVLFLLVLSWKKNKKRKLGSPKAVEKITANFSSRNYFLKFLFASIALASIILAVADLQRPAKGDPLKRKGVDIMIALDVSKSMLATDALPNRLEKSRQFIYKLMEEMKDDRVGLVVFAGHAYMQLPLTYDHSAARLYVQNASSETVPTQGTVISEALRLSGNAFNSKERKYKSILLITDGEDHDPDALALAPSLAENGIMINAIGIGSTSGVQLVDPATSTIKTDLNGQPVVTRLNESLLKQLAGISKGVYINLDNIQEAVKIVSAQIDTIEKTALDDTGLKDMQSFYFWFAGFALFLLILEFFWPEKKGGKE